MQLSKLLIVVVLVVVATISDMCRHTDRFTVDNRTEHDLLFVWLYDEDGESTLDTVEAGTTDTLSMLTRCMHPVVARLDDGTEFTRTEIEICNGDTWVIEDP